MDVWLTPGISPLLYRMEENIGGVKIWRMTLNLPNYPHPNILLAKKTANQALN